MKLKTYKKIICVFCAMVFTLSLVNLPPASALTRDEEIASLREKSKELEKKITEAENKIDALKDDIAQQKEYAAELQDQITIIQDKIYLLESEISILQGEIDELQAEIDEKEAEIEALNEETAELESEIELCENEIAETKEKLKKRLCSLYINGETSELELLFSADNFTNFLTRLELMSNITKYDTELVNSIRELAEKLESDIAHLEISKQALRNAQDLLEQDQAEIEVSKEEIESRKSAAEEERSSVQAKWNEAWSIIETLDEQNTAYVNSISKMEKDKAKFEAEMDALIKQKSSTGSGNVSALGFIWPMEYSSGTYISSHYGNRNGSFHGGVDITMSGASGKKIYAAAAGKVIIATYHYSYGNYVVIDHGDGVSTVYAHNSKIYVSVGSSVKRGDTIALCGSTGNSSGPHLHFEVRINGTRVNPEPYISMP